MNLQVEDLVHVALKVVKQANYFDISLGVAVLEEKAGGRDAGVGVLGAGVLGQKKTRFEPGAFPWVEPRSADALELLEGLLDLAG